jgi:hypothetical protein
VENGREIASARDIDEDLLVAALRLSAVSTDDSTVVANMLVDCQLQSGDMVLMMMLI